ncbi:heavy-metal-associated domain-containing protein [Azotobacter armeniacus]
MSDMDHRPGVHEAYLVKRHLKLEALNAVRAAAIAQEIDQLLGVDSVALDKATGRLDVAYDASHMRIEQVEEIVRKHGSDLDHGWWTHFKEGWYRFTDQNLRDNAHHEPWSHHKVLPRR